MRRMTVTGSFAVALSQHRQRQYVEQPSTPFLGQFFLRGEISCSQHFSRSFRHPPAVNPKVGLPYVGRRAFYEKANAPIILFVLGRN